MKRVQYYNEAVHEALKQASIVMDYNTVSPERVSQRIGERYHVECVYAEIDKNLVIPCTGQVENDFCDTDAKCQATCEELGMDVDNLSF